jgi:hypothetical protein
LALPNLSANWESAEHLLSEEDLFFEGNQTVRAAGSALNESSYWESFNEWRCFFTGQVGFGFSQAEWNPETRPGVYEKSPTISASNGDGDLEFDYEDIHFTGENADAVMGVWKELVAGERAICIYATYLQKIDEMTSLWILSGIETSKGYWPKEKSKFFNTSPGLN